MARIPCLVAGLCAFSIAPLQVEIVAITSLYHLRIYVHNMTNSRLSSYFVDIEHS